MACSFALTYLTGSSDPLPPQEVVNHGQPNGLAGGEMALQTARERSSRICEVIIFQKKGAAAGGECRVKPRRNILVKKRERDIVI